MWLRIRDGAIRALQVWAVLALAGTAGLAALGAVMGVVMGTILALGMAQDPFPERLWQSLGWALTGAQVGALLGASCGAVVGFVGGGLVGAVEAVRAPVAPDRRGCSPSGPAELAPAAAPEGHGDEVRPYR